MIDKLIPFNKPFLTGKETHYIYEAVQSGKISGNGIFTNKCQQFFEEKYGFEKCLLTTSCTDALEMAAILINIKEGDEVIMPSYTFVSTANAFVLRGAKIVFADSCVDNPNIDPDHVAKLINSKTKAIVVVHYAGMACDMDPIMELANQNDLFVIEDAAQAIDNYYKNRPLGGIGHLSAFSFHETKNIISGEGGMLVINDKQFAKRAEIIWEKGTNRSAFFRGEVDKYGWVDIGSSFLPSEIIAAFLYAQLEHLEQIQNRRKQIWQQFYNGLKCLMDNDKVRLPIKKEFSTNNAHMFYLTLNNIKERQGFISFLRENKVHAVFHYLSLHKSVFYKDKYQGDSLINCDLFADNLVRIPLYYELTDEQVQYIINVIKEYFESSSNNKLENVR